MASDRYGGGVRFTERLTVPVSYWLIAAAFGVTFIVAIGGYFHLVWFAVIAALGVAVIVAVLLGWGWVVVGVDAQGLAVGRSRLTWPYMGDITILDETELRDRLGPHADARAFLCVRPYIRQAVEIEVLDPADPHPSWLVASRKPHELAAAIEALRTSPRPDVQRGETNRRRGYPLSGISKEEKL